MPRDSVPHCIFPFMEDPFRERGDVISKYSQMLDRRCARKFLASMAFIVQPDKSGVSRVCKTLAIDEHSSACISFEQDSPHPDGLVDYREYTGGRRSGRSIVVGDDGIVFQWISPANSAIHTVHWRHPTTSADVIKEDTEVFLSLPDEYFASLIKTV